MKFLMTIPAIMAVAACNPSTTGPQPALAFSVFTGNGNTLPGSVAFVGHGIGFDENNVVGTIALETAQATLSPNGNEADLALTVGSDTLNATSVTSNNEVEWTSGPNSVKVSASQYPFTNTYLRGDVGWAIGEFGASQERYMVIGPRADNSLVTPSLAATYTGETVIGVFSAADSNEYIGTVTATIAGTSGTINLNNFTPVDSAPALGFDQMVFSVAAPTSGNLAEWSAGAPQLRIGGTAVDGQGNTATVAARTTAAQGAITLFESDPNATDPAALGGAALVQFTGDPGNSGTDHAVSAAFAAEK